MIRVSLDLPVSVFIWTDPTDYETNYMRSERLEFNLQLSCILGLCLVVERGNEETYASLSRSLVFFVRASLTRFLRQDER